MDPVCECADLWCVCVCVSLSLFVECVVPCHSLAAVRASLPAIFREPKRHTNTQTHKQFDTLRA